MITFRWLPWPCLGAALACGWSCPPQHPCHHHRYAVLVARSMP